jgi:two-component system cell cycle response regulator
MHQSKRILVVDDNATNLEIFNEMLGDEYIVETASNGHDAIELAEKHRPRVVLLDVMLPGIDGYETCRRLRSLPNMRHARIIMVSAKAMPSEQEQGYDAGADAYVTKPFDESELLSAIRWHEEIGSS